MRKRATPLLALALFALPALAVPAAGAAVTAELRVLTPDRVLDPGTTYVVGPERVRTDPGADCNFGGSGGTGAAYPFEKPMAISLLAAAARANPDLRPLSVTDEFGFGLAICGIGPVDDRDGTFWYLKRNHRELTVGADQERIRDGDELLVYLAPDNFPSPNPAELELRGPARATPGEPFELRAVEHACLTQPDPPFATSCESRPAQGVTVEGGAEPATTGADGVAQVTAPAGRAVLNASRGADIPAEPLTVCLSDVPGECPARHGERVLGSSGSDRIKGSRGSDVLRGRGGRDVIDIRRGGADRVDCGGGRDRVRRARADSDDRIAADCERITR